MEEKIAHYREMAFYVMDRPTLDSIDVLVARLEEEKRVLDPKTWRSLQSISHYLPQSEGRKPNLSVTVAVAETLSVLARELTRF
jgi:hypothetical protein